MAVLQRENKIKFGLLAPDVVPSSTVSGRVVAPLFATMPARCNHPKDKVGFGIKSTHRFPEDSEWVFVGFDFSQEELNVAGMFAESITRDANGTDPFNKALLVGDSNKKTDFHSLVANEVGIPRWLAKNTDYGLIYGAGVKTTTNTIMQGLDDSEKGRAKDYAVKTMESFKGKREGSKYRNGVASNYFNFVYNKSANLNARLDVFGQRIPKCLDVEYIHKSGSPSQINMFIQGACSTNGMLSAFLVFVTKEIQNLGIEDHCRFSLSVHDEIWYLCKEKYARKLSTAMVRAHCSVWALLSYNLGLPDLPLSRLIFDIQIDVTKCLRKSWDQVIKTPDFSYTEPGYYYQVNRKTGKLEKCA